MRAAPADDLERAVEVVNSWDTLDPSPEQIPDAEILGRFLRWIGRPDLRDLVTEPDLARFRVLRADLRRAFDAPDVDAALEALNGILGTSPARLRAERDDEGAVTTRVEAADGNPIGTLGLACAVALVAAVDSSGLSRFGICAGAPCTCVFVDRTRNHRRRFCSDRCNDRMAQVAHRRRVAAR